MCFFPFPFLFSSHSFSVCGRRHIGSLFLDSKELFTGSTILRASRQNQVLQTTSRERLAKSIVTIFLQNKIKEGELLKNQNFKKLKHSWKRQKIEEFKRIGIFKILKNSRFSNINLQLLTNQIEALSDQNYATTVKKPQQHEPSLTNDSVASRLVKNISVGPLFPPTS